jgi:flavin-binding protein dodecin
MRRQLDFLPHCTKSLICNCQGRPGAYTSANAAVGRHRGVEEGVMAESVYKIIEIVGTSPTSWEKAATAAVERAASSLRDLRVAEVCEQDIVIADGKIEAFRVRLKVSFKYED